MNIYIDNAYSASLAGNNEAVTTTYNAATRTGDKNIIAAEGYISDIADKVMDNEAYKGHGMTTDDIMQQAANTDVAVQKDFMIVMSHCVSGEDFEKMAEEGFSAGSCDAETYVTIVDRIKATLAGAGVDIEGYTDTLDVETLEEITGAVTKALEIKNISDDMVKYLVENNKKPTIENLYKAGYSTAEGMGQTKGYYSDGAYYAKKADDIDMESILPSIEQAVTKAGYTDGEKDGAIETAKWLVESGIELNTPNLVNAYNIRSLEFPLDEKDVSQMCVNAVINAKSPYEANLAGEKTIDEQSADIIDKVNNITDSQLHSAVEAGTELNINNISKFSKADEINESGDEASLKEIQARRELEEIRLMMSEEANRHLLRQGISVDTTNLTKLVDLLKDAEAQIKETLFKGGSNEANIELENLYNETLSKTDEIAQMPAAAIGPIASKIGTYTIEDIHETQSALMEAQAYKAGEYEKLMTAPRRDLGDSITKAFRNVDDILTDMGLETSDSNRRAVRILGYNSMEITNKNIEEIKEADRQVSSVIDKMTPGNVLKMIREQKNPLNMTMDELDDYLNNNSDDNLNGSEKYSKFLQKLDRSGDITSDERESYIGIYRLFNQIEKSDGAVIGSIVASGAEMNFKNMLSAVRTSKNKNMDVSIDDGFGALSKLITGVKTIDAQINEGFDNSANNENERNQEKYYASLSGEINNELADKTDVSKLKNAGISAQTTIEGFSDMLKEIRLLEETDNADFEAYKDSLNNAMQAQDKVINELLDFSQPVTAYNIEAAMLLNEDKNGLFGRLKNELGEDGLIDESDSFIENLSDKETARDLYDEIIKSASSVIDNYIYDANTTYIDIKAVQGMYKELSLLGGFSREENYQIPMNIGGEVTNVNLKIYHNKSDSGKVAVTLENDAIGKIAAEFLVDNDKITGMAACENDTIKDMLGNLSKDLEEAFEGRKINVSLAKSKSINLEMFGDDRDSENTTVSTSELYKTAKVFLKSLKTLEEL